MLKSREQKVSTLSIADGKSCSAPTNKQMENRKSELAAYFPKINKKHKLTKLESGE